jgi:polyhydroxyalkanoate synthesis regulator phasin
MPESTRIYSSFSDTIEGLDDNASESTIAKLQTTGDYLNEKSNFDNNLFDIESYSKALSDQNNSYRTSKEDENLYGFIPGDWLPDWVKAGYNQSIQGLSERILTGNERFDLKNYNPKILEDIGSTIVSFLQPADIGLMIATGGVGGLAVKSATKASVKKALQTQLGKGARVSDDLVKSILGENVVISSGIRPIKTKLNPNLAGRSGGIGEAFRATTNPLNEAKRRLSLQGISAKKADEIIEKVAPRVVHQAIQAGAVGGVNLGFYSGLQSSLGQIGDPEQEFDLLMNIKNASKGAVLGAVTAGSAPVVRSILKPNLSKATQEIAVKAVETAEFGTIAPLLEGELPTPEDYAHAAGVIGALGAQRYATSKITKGYKKIRDAKNEVALTAREGAEIFTRADTPMIEARQVYTDINGVKVRDVKFKTRDKTVQKKDTGIGVETTKLKEDIVEFKDFKTGDPLDPITFAEFQSRGFTRSGGKYTPEALQNKRLKAISSIQKEINLNNEDFKKRATSVTGLNYKVNNPNKILNSMTPAQQLKFLNRMHQEARVVSLSKKFKENGWETTAIPNKLLSDYLGIKFLDRSGKRLKTQIQEELKRRVDKNDTSYFYRVGDISKRLNDIGLFAEGFPRFKEDLSNITGGKLFKGTKQKLEKQGIELGEKLQNPKFKDDPMVKAIREIFDDMWDEAQKIGVDLGKKEEFYFPRIVRQDVLKIFAKDLGALRAENPQLFTENSNYNKPEFQKLIGEIVEKGKISKETKKALYDMAGFSDDVVRSSNPDFDSKISSAFKRINTTTNVQFYNVAKNLEISRKAKELPKNILERDARIVISKYVHQWARRVSEVENFGREGEFWKASLDVLAKSASKERTGSKRERALMAEHDVIDKLYKISTNKIELDSSYNWKSPQARKVWSDIVDFEIGSKIGLGFATVPNLTQISISTAVKAGYYPVIKGIYKLSTSKEYRDQVAKSGISNISIYQSLAGLNPNDSLMGKFAEGATWLSGFKKINQINSLVSAASAREWINMLQPIAQGKGTGKFKLRQQWAIKNLADLGINNINKITERQTAEAMYKFARDTQLQRNILEEPLVFNDPRFRPLFLFKKFGYKQFNWIRDQLGAELKRGNVFPMLRLASAGLLGGEFVSLARDKLASFYAGEEVYNENEKFLNYGNLKDVAFGSKKIDSLVNTDRMTWGDVLDRFAAVGGMGIAMDIVAAENTIRAIEFAGKPAVVQDFDKIWDAMTRTWVNLEEYGGLGALQRMPKYIAPILGTVPRRLAQRIEPAGQKESYVKYRKGLTRSKILDFLIEGDSIRATRLIKNWNRSFPQNPILYDDIGVSEITDRLLKKAKKKAKP